ncbi:unnamed protein product [Bemisia tabaci]|nr:unnamed protein product [Bemisia tabaci]
MTEPEISHAMPKPEIESGLKSPRKGSVSPEKRPLLSTGKTAITTGGKPPKHSSTSTSTGIRAGLHKIGEVFKSKEEGYKRLDKGKSPALSPEEQIVFGVFKKEGGHSITFEECGEKCKAHFGEMYLPNDDNRAPLALPIIVKDKKTKAVSCNCTMNAEQIHGLLKRVKLGDRYRTDFLSLARQSFCSARLWLYGEEVPVDIPYEVESKERKSQAEKAKFSRLTSISGAAVVSPLVAQRIIREEDERKAQLKRLEREKNKKVEGSSKDRSKKGKDAAEISPDEERKARAEMEKNKRMEASSEDPSKKGESVAEIEMEEEGEIIVGVFPSRKEHEEAFTKESCKTLCKEFFGYVEMWHGSSRTGLTQPKLLDNSKTCSCIVNPALTLWAVETGLDTTFLEDFRHFYCNGQFWFSRTGKTTGLFYISNQYDMDSTQRRNREETFNAAKAREIHEKKLPAMRRSEEAKEQSEAKPHQSEGKAQQSKAGAQQSKAKVQSHMILVGSIHRNWRETLTIESCQKKCNDKFGFVSNWSESAPPGATGHNRPQITWAPIQFTTAKVSANGKDCECYFNQEEIYEYLDGRKGELKVNKIKNTLDWLLKHNHNEKDYNEGVKSLRIKQHFRIVDANGRDKDVP